PSINTLTYEAKTGAYSFQLDETWFVLDANILREALEITLIDQAYQFMSPSSSNAIMDFVNELGYTEARLLGLRMEAKDAPQGLSMEAKDAPQGEASSLFDFEEVMSIPHNNQGPPPMGPLPPQNNNGPPSVVSPNGIAPRSMEELCQPSINGRGGLIAPIPIQATDFGLRHHMI
nr:reverse transcriptase domain-containing protein [Tanacetum cinerariifolium]